MLSFDDLFNKPRKSATSYSELLPWFGQVAPGLVLCKDGSLLAAFSFVGADVEGRENSEVDHRIDQFQTALKTLNDRITLWSVQERRYTPGYPRGEFSSPVADLVDSQWERACASRKGATINQHLFLSYNFPNQSEAFFEAVSAELQENDGNVLKALSGLAKRRLTEKGAVARVRGQLADMAHEFEKILSTFSGIVENTLGFYRLIDGDLMGELYARANIASHRGPVHLPAGLNYLDTALAADRFTRQNDQLLFEGMTQTVHVAALSTTTMPPAAYSGHIDQLMGADCEYILVQCFRFLDRMKAESLIQDAEMFYLSEVKSVMTRVFERLFDQVSEKENTGNIHLAQDAQQALVELTASDLSYGYYNMTLLALGESKRHAEAAADLLGGSLRANGFTVMRERHGLMSAFLTSLPGNSGTTMRWKLASTANIADLSPIRTISRGEPNHPMFSKLLGHSVPPLCRFLTPYGIPYDFNTHEGDLGHTAIVGGSGAGKTTLMTLLIAQFKKYNPSQTFIFDKDYSLMAATVLLGGKHIDMSPRGTRRGMNPVRVMMINDDDMRLRQWIEVLITAGGNTVSSNESSAIFTAIQGLRRSPPNSWRLSGIYALIAGADRDLAAKIAPYVDLTDADDDFGTGPFASFFDNDEDNFELTNMVGLECAGILESKQLASPFMDYAFYCIERSLDGMTPTMIYVEEAWYMLSNPAFAQKMEDWLRTFRKKRAFVIFATQALDEIARLPNVGSFVTNIPCQIFLPSVKSSVREQAALFRSVFGTTDAQIELLAHAIPKRDYLLVKPSVTRLVTTQMPPAILAINDATSNELRRSELAELAVSGKPGWEINYLKDTLHVQV